MTYILSAIEKSQTDRERQRDRQRDRQRERESIQRLLLIGVPPPSREVRYINFGFGVVGLCIKDEVD